MTEIEPPAQRHPPRGAFRVLAPLAGIAFVLLAIAAHRVAYFPIDLAITRDLQRLHGHGLERFMVLVSWFGFTPQVDILGAMLLLALYLSGHRRAAAAALIAAGGVGMGLIVKQIVARPRPVMELVTVSAPLDSMSFPSGHVLMVTIFGRFLAFLACGRLRPGWGRVAVLVATLLLVLLMGVSRIWLGQHWFRDVIGACLLGIAWLGLTLAFYRRRGLRDSRKR